MRKFMLLLTGVGIGFFAAHFVSQTPEGKRFFDLVNQGARELNGAVQDGYRQEAEELIEDVEAALKNLRSKV